MRSIRPRLSSEPPSTRRDRTPRRERSSSTPFTSTLSVPRRNTSAAFHARTHASFVQMSVLPKGARTAAVSGVQFRTLPGPGGRMTAEEVQAAIDQSHYHMPRISLLVWENTHNVSGGTVVPYQMMVAASAVARDGGLSVHIDGARIFNAVAATGTPAEDFAALADTIQFCFSKGLGAPIGSVLCGSEEVIAEARHVRKRLGGGMRQVGVIAAPARIALRDRERIGEDHLVARRLAEGLADRYPEAVDVARVETNMVVVDGRSFPFQVAEMVGRLHEQGVIIGTLGPHMIRLVTHRDVNQNDVERLLAVVDELRQ